MAKRIKESESTPSWTPSILLFLFSAVLVLSLHSYDPLDPSFNSSVGDFGEPTNMLGYLGSWTADLFLQAFGILSWAWPVMIVSSLFRWVFHRDQCVRHLGPRLWIGLALILVSGGILLNAISFEHGQEAFPASGMLGIVIYELTLPWVGNVGILLISLVGLWSALMIWWPGLCNRTLELAALATSFVFRRTGESITSLKEKHQERKLAKQSEPKLQVEDFAEAKQKTLPIVAEDEPLGVEARTQFIPAIKQKVEEQGARKTASRRREARKPQDWHIPPMSLMEKPVKIKKDLDKKTLLATAQKISGALNSFDIEGDITEISPGPIITLYEFQPAPGIRVQKIMSVSTDLAMALGVPSVRIVAPIPGKSVAGIEVPNEVKENIVLRDVFEATSEKAESQKLPLVLGRDGEGRPICEDLSRMPHLLIGGATNMGKSVLVNSILSSLLCRFTPEELRLIIVDPKLVEFKIYEDIPHLMLPIVNDPMDASQALKWAVNETKKRYLDMQKLSARNLESYNKKVLELEENEDELECFPYIVIIIDELAELMLTAKKDVEQSIVRLSQLARAAGIHLVMATQRPSADVVTGLIKSNCPSRASLRVASATDSRIILDTTGAEQLLGKGDMFFTNSGPMGLRRMQGCFVRDDEVERICNFWRDQGEPEYHEEILEEKDFDEAQGDPNKHDSLFKEVVSFAKDKGSISTSLIQRRFQIGYTRAARIMEQLEESGIVGEQQAAGKAREVLI